ncbi:MAG: hypothetical protein ACOYO1_18715 [Bacteroidales bacterium]
MDAFEFISNYNKFLEEIENVIKPELLPTLEKLKEKNSHDLITPETWFVSPNQARGFVWVLFLKIVRETQV